VERRDVDSEDLVVDLVPEVRLLEAGRDEPGLVRPVSVSPRRHLDHLR
jgi:hypothetical protein